MMFSSPFVSMAWMFSIIPYWFDVYTMMLHGKIDSVAGEDSVLVFVYMICPRTCANIICRFF